MTKKKIAESTLDPTLTFTQITINGRELKMCFDFAALAEAETRLIAEGHKVNLLLCLDPSALTLAGVRVIFAAAIQKAHPDIPYEEAVKLVTLTTVYPIANAILEAWTASVTVPDTDANPQEPDPAK